MRIVCISDTHNRHWDRDLIIPDGDILVHAGDMAIRGMPGELHSVSDWFVSMTSDKFKAVVFTPGNHDRLFEVNQSLARSYFNKANNIHCLIDEAVTIDGVRFYGSPHTIWFHDWAFNVEEELMYKKWDKIPVDTDVLITHSPPKSIGDLHRGLNLGCEALLTRIDELDIKLHVFGHIHPGHGSYTRGKVTHINAAILDDTYKIANQPIVFDI